jgi:hypothetical protein
VIRVVACTTIAMTKLAWYLNYSNLFAELQDLVVSMQGEESLKEKK